MSDPAPEPTVNKPMADPPTPASNMTEAEKWLELLPAPPLNDFDDGMVEIWMRNCAKVGGLEALDWLWNPSNWPLGSACRARVFHVPGAIRREFENQARWKAEQAAAEQEAKRRDAHRELLRAKGWRVT